MKQFRNSFSALVELTNVGLDVVFAKVTTSMGVSIPDRDVLSSRILSELLPDSLLVRRFYNGNYVIVSRSDLQNVTNACALAAPAVYEFDASVELDDGLVHSIHFSLVKSSSDRRDYVVGDTRSIILRGTASFDVNDANDDGEDASES